MENELSRLDRLQAALTQDGQAMVIALVILIIGLFAAVGLTGGIVLLATLFNLVSDIIGGVRMTVLEEEVVAVNAASPAAIAGQAGDTRYKFEAGWGDKQIDEGSSSGNDTLDFRNADDGTANGITIDMDLVGWDADGQVRIFVRDLDEVHPRVLAGTDAPDNAQQ